MPPKSPDPVATALSAELTPPPAAAATPAPAAPPPAVRQPVSPVRLVRGPLEVPPHMRTMIGAQVVQTAKADPLANRAANPLLAGPGEVIAEARKRVASVRATLAAAMTAGAVAAEQIAEAQAFAAANPAARPLFEIEGMTPAKLAEFQSDILAVLDKHLPKLPPAPAAA